METKGKYTWESIQIQNGPDRIWNMVLRAGLRLSDAWGTHIVWGPCKPEQNVKLDGRLTRKIFNYRYCKWCNFSHSGTYFVNEIELYCVTICCFQIAPPDLLVPEKDILNVAIVRALFTFLSHV